MLFCFELAFRFDEVSPFCSLTQFVCPVAIENCTTKTKNIMARVNSDPFENPDLAFFLIQSLTLAFLTTRHQFDSKNQLEN